MKKEKQKKTGENPTTLRLSPVLRALISEASAALGVSRSAFIRIEMTEAAKRTLKEFRGTTNGKDGG